MGQIAESARLMHRKALLQLACISSLSVRVARPVSCIAMLWLLRAMLTVQDTALLVSCSLLTGAALSERPKSDKPIGFAGYHLAERL